MHCTIFNAGSQSVRVSGPESLNGNVAKRMMYGAHVWYTEP